MFGRKYEYYYREWMAVNQVDVLAVAGKRQQLGASLYWCPKVVGAECLCRP